jgi:hypothetical protein
MTYNAEQLRSELKSEFSNEKKGGRIVDSIDEYANTSRGMMACANMDGSGDDTAIKTFARGAMKHVKQDVYGSFLGSIAWMVAKWIVWEIIKAYIRKRFAVTGVGTYKSVIGDGQ